MSAAAIPQTSVASTASAVHARRPIRPSRYQASTANTSGNVAGVVLLRIAAPAPAPAAVSHFHPPRSRWIRKHSAATSENSVASRSLMLMIHATASACTGCTANSAAPSHAPASPNRRISRQI